MSTELITSVSLEPYSKEMLLVFSGVSAEQVLKYFSENVTYSGCNTIKDIKQNSLDKAAWLELIKKSSEEIDLLNNEGDLKISNTGLFIFEQHKHKDSWMYMICLKKGFDPTNPEDMITLSHEVLHLCQNFLSKFLNRDEEQEAEAYFHSHIMRFICSYF